MHLSQYKELEYEDGKFFCIIQIWEMPVDEKKKIRLTGSTLNVLSVVVGVNPRAVTRTCVAAAGVNVALVSDGTRNDCFSVPLSSGCDSREVRGERIHPGSGHHSDILQRSKDASDNHADVARHPGGGRSGRRLDLHRSLFHRTSFLVFLLFFSEISFTMLVDALKSTVCWHCPLLWLCYCGPRSHT